MQRNVAGQKIALYAFDTTTSAAKTGDAANITPYVSKDGGAVTVLGTATVAELSSTNAPGLYELTLTQAETNADRLLFSAKSSTANVSLVPVQVFTRPPYFSSLVISSGGNVSVASGIKKNQALPAFQFQMTDSTNHAPVTGKTVTVQRSIDGGAYSSVGTAAEIGNGIYKIDFAAGDMNGTTIAVRCTGTGCDDLNFTMVTEP